jgi:hypothetical protein
MKISKIKGFDPFDRHNDDGFDLSDPRTFLHSIFPQQGGNNAPPPHDPPHGPPGGS